MPTLRDRQNLLKILERKAELAARGETLAQQRLYQAETDVEVKLWEKRNSVIALDEINQEFESQLITTTTGESMGGSGSKLVWRVGRENQARDCQAVEELRRICCEETDRARQARIDELSVRQERNPTTVSQLLTQIQDLQNNVNSLSDAKELYDPASGSSSGATHVPIKPSTIPSPRTMPCRDSGL